MVDNKHQSMLSQRIFQAAKKIRADDETLGDNFHLMDSFGKKWQPERTTLLDQADEYKSANIKLSVVPPRDKIILRGQKSTLAQAVKRTLGLEMPKPLHYQLGKKDSRLSWLSPDEWMLNTPLSSGDGIKEKLAQELAGKYYALIDVSDYYIDIALKGDASLLLINKGSPFNTDERYFSLGQVISTHYANATIVLSYLETSFEIQVRTSFAVYLWEYLVTAAKEFG
ncbi:MAG: sarcosine oxidase subunit gamma [Alphaproteobacteria bacterium]